MGRKIAEEEKDQIRKKLEGVDVVFLLAGLGGGLGAGLPPVVVRLARRVGPWSCFCPTSFSWEKSRHSQAHDCLAELRKFANAVVPLPNDSLFTNRRK